jgi:polyisoprenoid-binding protein YceI
VAIGAGTYRLGPENGTLSVRTGRTGAAAKAGHDLVMDVTAWEATLEAADDPADTRVELSADAGSLRVREGRGGMQALGEDDKANIEQTIDDEVLKRQDIAFRSTRVRAVAGGSRLDVRGELELLGTTRPVAIDLAVAGDGTLSAVAIVRQTDWGMKPYSALFGALKVADEVVVWIKAALPQSR